MRLRFALPLLLTIVFVCARPAAADPIVIGQVTLTFHVSPGPGGMYGGYSNIVNVSNFTSVGLVVDGYSATWAPIFGSGSYTSVLPPVTFLPGTSADYMEFSLAAYSSQSIFGHLSSPYFHINGIQYIANSPQWIAQIYNGVDGQTRIVGIFIDATAVPVKEVPEPASLFLLATGLAGVAGVTRRRS